MPSEPARPQPQDLLITLVGNELLHHPGRRVWAGGLVDVLATFGFSTSASRAAIGRLAKRGLLERHREGREVFFSLTERAEVRLLADEARILGFITVDGGGVWTMLSYALPQHQRASRDRLRRRLGFLGYGPTADGSWIAPGDRVADTERVLRDLDLADGVDMFVGRPAMSTDIGRLVHRAWPDLDRLGEQYETFCQRWSTTPPPLEEPLGARTLLMHEWRQFPLIDPGLADLHLPWAATRAAARDLFQHTWHRLAAPAAEQFATTCRLTAAKHPA